ncbi:MAG TPA: coproporphyrinogen III oxidase, partial [Woeseiaceae bacterium]|nr:coproporphyrinogen III oxidase [Woeseiaceae bacterium]
MSNIDDVKAHLSSLQNRICAELETLDGRATFARDTWERPGGGGGESRVMSDGAVFEQAGVGFS